MDITIVGGGFAGVKAALELSKNSENTITLVSDKPDFQYYPALYSAATGHSHLESWVPLGTIFAGKSNIKVFIDTIKKVDVAGKSVTGTSGKVYTYDQCIIAVGMVTSYFGIKGLETYAYGIKSAAEIKKLKQHLYTDIAERQTTDKRYIVVGAGPTGVELAAALGAYLHRMCRHYGVKKAKISIDLIEAAPRILPRMDERSSRLVLKRLKKLGVKVQTGKVVEEATADDLTVSGKSIDSRTVIWTSGVANHPFYKANEKNFTFGPGGRIVVDEYMQAAENIYVIGDNASTPHSGLAQTALHDAIFVARNINRQLSGDELKKYVAVKPPVVVPVGDNWAIFEWKGIRIGGRIGSMIRRAADFIGYSDILPVGHALGVWHASKIIEDDYFTPTLFEK